MLAHGNWQKRPASRDLSDGAVRRPIIMATVGAQPPTLHGCEARTNLLFTMYAKQAGHHRRTANSNFSQMICASPYGAGASSGIAQNKDGGAYRDRTDDPLLAKQVLSQLS